MNTDQYVWLTKYNPYHGKDGKFTSGGGAKTTVPDSHTSAKKIMAASTTEARTHSSASAGKTTAKPKKRRKPKAPVPQTTNAEDIANCTFLRKDPPPRNTRKAYKVFFTKNGKLYPPMVANPGGAPTPFGVWLDAREGEKAGTSKTGRPQVKQGGKGTQGGSGKLAYRPGWHLGDTPDAKQFARKDDDGVRTLFPKNFVWAECTIDADHDYQEEAMSYGYTKTGKFQHSLAGLPKLPKGGCYKYRTNPRTDTNPWWITGSMRVDRLLNDKETDEILRQHHIKPMKRQGGRVDDLAQLGLPSSGTFEKSYSLFSEINKSADVKVRHAWFRNGRNE